MKPALGKISKSWMVKYDPEQSFQKCLIISYRHFVIDNSIQLQALVPFTDRRDIEVIHFPQLTAQSYYTNARKSYCTNFDQTKYIT